MVWWFDGDGIARLLRIRAAQGRTGPRLSEKEVPLGPWHVYRDAPGAERLVLCFAYRRGRASPSCRYLQIDTVPGEVGRPQRVLKFQNWVGERQKTPEVFVERIP